MSSPGRGGGRKSLFTKQYKKACGSLAALRDPSKNELPLEISDRSLEEDEEVVDLKWFFKNREKSGVRWSRLHLGLGPGQNDSLVEDPSGNSRPSTVRNSVRNSVVLKAAMKEEELFAEEDFARNYPNSRPSTKGNSRPSTKEAPRPSNMRNSGSSNNLRNSLRNFEPEAEPSSVGPAVLGLLDTSALAGNGQRAGQQRMKQTLQRSVSPSELEQATAPEQLQKELFPPLNVRRNPENNGKAKQNSCSNHYQFFAKHCGSDGAVKRGAMEQRVELGKIVPLDTPRVLLGGRSQSSNTTGARRSQNLSEYEKKKLSFQQRKSEASRQDEGQPGSAEDQPARTRNSITGNGQASESSGPGQHASTGVSPSIAKLQKAGRAANIAAKLQPLGGKRASQRASVSEPPLPPLSNSKKGACEALRMAIYGKTGNELAKTDKEAQEIFNARRGTHFEVVRLFQTWREMDVDESGDLTCREVMEFFRSKGLGVGLSRSLQGIFGSSDGAGKLVRIEDLMRVMWPRCQDEDITWMKDVIFDFRAAGHKEEQLKELAGEMLDDLRATFTTVDLDDSGGVRIPELVASGMISQDKAFETMRQFGLSEEDDIYFPQFCEIMCPPGYFVPRNTKLRI